MKLSSGYVPSEENLALILSGEISDPVFDLEPEDVDLIRTLRLCPRDARPLESRDNPRHPGLNEELFCSCGYAGTT